MQRILNDPDNIVDEMLQGFFKAHCDLVERTSNPRVVKAKNIPRDKVGVVPGISLHLWDMWGKTYVMQRPWAKFFLLRRQVHFWMP